MSKFMEIYEKIKDQEPRPRGFAFEKLVNKIFSEEGSLIQPSV